MLKLSRGSWKSITVLHGGECMLIENACNFTVTMGIDSPPTFDVRRCDMDESRFPNRHNFVEGEFGSLFLDIRRGDAIEIVKGGESLLLAILSPNKRNFRLRFNGPRSFAISRVENVLEKMGK